LITDIILASGILIFLGVAFVMYSLIVDSKFKMVVGDLLILVGVVFGFWGAIL